VPVNKLQNKQVSHQHEKEKENENKEEENTYKNITWNINVGRSANVDFFYLES
jgi:hypothetical protein